MAEITLVSAFHDTETLALFQANTMITKLFNPDTEFEWLLVNNSSHTIAEPPPGVTVIPGYTKGVLVGMAKPASLHLSLAYDKGVREAETQYVCIVDSDFYCMQYDWMDRMMNFLDDGDEAFLGAPYSPKWFEKAQPITTHFLLIDTEKTGKGRLSFGPNMKDGYKAGRVEMFLRKLHPFFFRRFRIGKLYDCGSLIYDLHPHNTFSWLTPTHIEETDYRGSLFDKLLDYVIPKRWRLMRDIPYVQMKQLAKIPVEAFLWEGAIFAIHYRGTGPKYFDAQESTPMEQKIRLVQELTTRFLQLEKGRFTNEDLA